MTDDRRLSSKRDSRVSSSITCCTASDWRSESVRRSAGSGAIPGRADRAYLVTDRISRRDDETASIRPNAPAAPHSVVRRLSDHRTDRIGRHGRGLQAPRPHARSHRRRQGAAAGRLERADPHFLQRSASARALQRSPHRPDPRVSCRRGPAVIIMEFVDGFELGRVGPSLEYRAARADHASRSAKRSTTRTRSACSIAT